MTDIRITDVIAYPLTCRIPVPQRTGFAEFTAMSIVLVEIRTDAGITCYGECLGRFAPTAYAEAVRHLLRPIVLGANALDIQAHWQRMQRSLSGRSGGMLLEAIAGVDTALWDIAGKVAGLPVHCLLGSMGRQRITAYGSSVNWLEDDVARADTEAFLAAGLRSIKVKIGAPVERAVARIGLIRQIAGPEISLSVDANSVYSVDDAIRVGRALQAQDYLWFEEPIAAEDIGGYRHLRAHLDVRLAAGEQDYTVQQARELIAERLVGVIQPDVARSGGISETRRIYDLAHAFHVQYCPHVGWSGGVCLAASLHLAAAAPNVLMLEYMLYPNPLRDALTVEPVGRLVDGAAVIPDGPGLGFEINWDTVAQYRAA